MVLNRKAEYEDLQRKLTGENFVSMILLWIFDEVIDRSRVDYTGIPICEYI